MDREDAIAILSDLLLERKKITETLEKLESNVLSSKPKSHLDKIFSSGPISESLSRLEKIGNITQSLISEFNYENLVAIDSFLKKIAESTYAFAQSLNKKIKFIGLERLARLSEIKVDQDILNIFRPIFLEMISGLIEFSIESEKERQLRSKPIFAKVFFDAATYVDGVKLRFYCDGNGLELPQKFIDSYHSRLADCGVIASFEGKSTEWSSWVFYLPTVSFRKNSLFRAVECEIETLGVSTVFVPAFYIKDMGRALSSNGIELNIGLKRKILPVKRFKDFQEVFMHSLSDDLSADERFFGVVIGISAGNHIQPLSNRLGEKDSMTLVLNPYGFVKQAEVNKL